MRRRLASLLALVLLPSSTTTCAQKQVRFTFTGFVQAITQYDSESDYTRVSNITIPHDQPTTRMGIRRRRLAAIAAYGDLAARLEVNATEQKISIFNVYAEYKPHWAGRAFVKEGLMAPNFGYGLPYSSSKRAAFERSYYMGDLFPRGIDIGLAMRYNGALDQSKRW